MLVDSHCHIDFPELAADLPGVLARMHAAGVTHALCICVSLEAFPAVLAIAERYANVYATVGVHPDHQPCGSEPTVERLAGLAEHPRVVGIGETGLDYHRLSGDLEWQRTRFRTHIRAARLCGKPLIVHTREAAQETLAIMREEGAAGIGGVMHCFTESLDIAEQAMDLGFHISLSGIVTFKNAWQVQAMASAIPLERMLIETDAPYLAPVPHRGKTNEPAYVRHVAEQIANLKDIKIEVVGNRTSRNFFELFRVKHEEHILID